MNFCAKCGTQMNDEAEKCPQCQAPTNNQQSSNSSKKQTSKKPHGKTTLLIIINIILTALILVALLIFHFAPIATNNSNIGDNSSISAGESFSNNNSVCPAQEYGNHDWMSASCIEPAQCFYCASYKDDILGHHNFHYDEEIEEVVCWYCNILKDEYDNEE